MKIIIIQNNVSCKSKEDINDPKIIKKKTKKQTKLNIYLKTSLKVNPNIIVWLVESPENAQSLYS